MEMYDIEILKSCAKMGRWEAKGPWMAINWLKGTDFEFYDATLPCSSYILLSRWKYQRVEHCILEVGIVKLCRKNEV